MEIKIIAFGQLAEIIGKEIILEAKDIASLKVVLIKNFHILADRKYAIAVNQKLVNENYIFAENDTVALMPPYSGG